MQLEEDPATEQALDLGPRANADLLHHRAAAADEDLLLRLGLDEHVGAGGSLRQLLDLDRDRVRDLLSRQLESLLAHELRHLQLDGEIGSLLRREVERPFRQQRDELLT